MKRQGERIETCLQWSSIFLLSHQGCQDCSWGPRNKQTFTTSRFENTSSIGLFPWSQRKHLGVPWFTGSPQHLRKRAISTVSSWRKPLVMTGLRVRTGIMGPTIEKSHENHWKIGKHQGNSNKNYVQSCFFFWDPLPSTCIGNCNCIAPKPSDVGKLVVKIPSRQVLDRAKGAWRILASWNAASWVDGYPLGMTNSLLLKMARWWWIYLIKMMVFQSIPELCWFTRG